MFWHENERPRSGTALFDLWLASVGRNAGLHLNLTPDRRGLIPEGDVVELRRFRGLVEAFTAVDLLRGRGEGALATLTDGDPSTWWAADACQAEIVLPLGGNRTVGGVRLEEAVRFGQRVQGFMVELHYGGAWYELARGTTIGAQRILALPNAHGDALRLRILASQAPAVLSRVMAYAG